MIDIEKAMQLGKAQAYIEMAIPLLKKANYENSSSIMQVKTLVESMEKFMKEQRKAEAEALKALNEKYGEKNA